MNRATTIEAWIQREQNGDSIIVDPASGEPVTPGTSSLFLSDDRRYLDHLESAELVLDLAFGAHVKAVDLDKESDPEWFEKRLSSPDLAGYFYEGFGGNISSATAIRLDGLILRILPWPRRGFTERRNYAIATSRAYCAPYDIQSRFGGINQTAATLDSLLAKISKDAEPKECLEALAVSQYAREWAISTNIGRLAYRLTEQRELRKKAGSCNVLMTTGAAHQGLISKLGSMGVDVTAVFLNKKSYENSWPVDYLPPIMASSCITAEQFLSFDEMAKNNYN